MKLRVVFDTSTLVGAILRANSTPYEAFQKALDSCTLCISTAILAELRTVLARNRFRKYATLEARLEFGDVISRRATQFTVESDDLVDIKPPCRDPKDTMFLALALVAKAAIIFSSDHDLLALHPWNGIPILTPAQFVAQFSA